MGSRGFSRLALLWAALSIAAALLPLPAFAQGDIASLKAELAKASGKDRLPLFAKTVSLLAHADAEEGLKLGTAGLAEARTLGDRKGEADILVAIATCLNILGRNEEALAHYGEARAIFEALGDKLGLLTCRRSAGISYYDLGRMDKALEEYLGALRMAEELDDPAEIGKTASNIGNVYRETGKLEDALRYQEQALAAFEKANFRVGIAGGALNLGTTRSGLAEVAEKKGEASRAQQLRRQAVADYEKSLLNFRLLEIPRGVSAALNSLAGAEYRGGNPALALTRVEEALELRRKVGDKYGEVESLMLLSEIRTALGQKQLAIRSMSEAVRLGESVQANNLLLDGYGELGALLREAGDFRGALEAFERRAAIQKKLDEEQVSERLNELKLKYDDEKKSKEIELLRRDQQIKELELKRQATIVRAAIAGVLSVALIALLIYNRYRLRVRAEKQLEIASRTDHLTGLSNRRDLMEKIEYERTRARRGPKPLTLVICDADNFKAINDTHGHNAGDTALRFIARTLRETARAQDIVGRWGGEEFVIVLPDTDAPGGAVLAEKVRAALHDRICSTESGVLLPVTLTLGVAQERPDEDTDRWIRRADDALLKGKREGKNRVVVG
jgi:diguanylate cyclase (GGDEF)-like protein